MSIKLEPLAELIRESAYQVILNSPSALAELAREDSADNSEALAKLEVERRKLDRLEGEFFLGDSGLSKGRYLQLRATLEANIAALTSSLSMGTSRNIVSANLPTSLDGLRQAWNSNGLDWQRAFLGVVYKEVVVLPADHKGQRFSPDRVRLILADEIGA